MRGGHQGPPIPGPPMAGVLLFVSISPFCPLTFHSGGQPWLLEVCGHGQAAGEISDTGIIQVQAWGADPQVPLASGSRAGSCKSPGSTQQPQLTSVQAGVCGRNPDARPSRPSVIGPAQPGCLPSLGEGWAGEGGGRLVN